MSWLRNLTAIVAGIVATLILLPIIGYVTEQVLIGFMGDGDSAGWALVIGLPIWIILIASISIYGGVATGYWVRHKILPEDQKGPAPNSKGTT
jgi:hypothetical protein